MRRSQSSGKKQLGSLQTDEASHYTANRGSDAEEMGYGGRV